MILGSPDFHFQHKIGPKMSIVTAGQEASGGAQFKAGKISARGEGASTPPLQYIYIYILQLTNASIGR